MKTQNQILSELQKDEPLSILELSKRLGLTKAAIRYHMRFLMESDAILAVHPSERMYPGRPATRYKLNRLPNPMLSKMLIHVLCSELLKEKKSTLHVKKIANIIAAAIKNVVCSPHNSGAAGINQQVEKYKKLGFSLHWEITKNGPVYNFDSEPLSAVIPDAILVSAVLEVLKNI